MWEEIVNIIWSAVGVAVIGLVTFGVRKLTCWIDSKISDKQAAGYLSTIINLVGNAVKEVYQTYVEALKNENLFDDGAQKKALNDCLEKIKSQLAPEIAEYVIKNFGDLDDYLKSLIESTIYTLKANAKKDK